MSAFAGRGRELEAATSALGTSGTVLLIHGPAGQGKTRLLEEALARAAPSTVVYASANQLDADLAFAPLITGLAAELDRLTPAGQIEALEHLDAIADLFAGYGGGSAAGELRPAEGSVNLTRRLEALRQLIRRLADPALLVLDDAHWADTGTLEAVAHMARDRRGMSFALTYRDDEIGPTLRAALSTLRRTDDLVVDLQLDPLSPDEIAAVAEGVLGGAITASLAAFLVARTSGNPLFLVALTRHLRDRGLVTRPRLGAWRLVDDAEASVPAEVADVLEQRTADLPESAQRLLEALGVADAATRPNVLATVLDVPRADVDDTLDALDRAGLTVDLPDGRVAAAHPLIAQAAHERLGGRHRRRLHAAFVDAADSSWQPGRVARHIRFAGNSIPAEQALPALRAAGRRALDRDSPREAISHLQAALERARTERSDLVSPLLRQLAQAWSFHSEHGVAMELLLSALDAATDDAERAAVHHALVISAYYQGHHDAALLHVQSALALEPAMSTSSTLRWRQAHTAATFGDTEQLAAAAEAVADRADVDAWAGLTVTLAAQSSGDFATVRRLVAAHCDVELEPGFSMAGARFNSPGIQLAAYDLDTEAMHAHVAALQKLADVRASPMVMWRARFSEQWVGVITGDRALIGRAADFASTLPSGDALPARVMAGVPAAMAGDLDAVADLSAQPLAGMHPVMRAQVDADLAIVALVRAGRSGDAHPHLGVPVASHMALPPITRLCRALAHHALGDTGSAEAHIRDLSAMGQPDLGIQLLAALGHAVVAEDAAAMIRVADRAAARGWVLLQAWAARLAATLQLAADEDPITMARQAIAAADRADQTVDGAAARAVLRAVGVSASAPRRRAGGVLTARQGQIAALVAGGLSNADIAERLFISVRTVTTHLDHIYSRLGISSRLALATWVRDSDVGAQTSS